ncbi:MAG: hypothetical protein ACOYOE_11480 [Chlorobium sp.]
MTSPYWQCQKSIEALKPSAVIIAGIAFGVNEKKQAIGDILVTEQLLPYELQRNGPAEEGKPQIVLCEDKPHASQLLIDQCNSACLLWKGAKVHFGKVLSGEKLDDNVDFRDQLVGFEQEAIACEMEGAGLYVACEDNTVDWIVIKAICGWADGYKDEESATRQKIAAENAVDFVLHALQVVPVDWERERSQTVKFFIGHSGEIFEIADYLGDDRMDCMAGAKLSLEPWHEILRKEMELLEIGKVTFNPPDTMKCGATERIETRIAKNIKTDLITTLKGRGIPKIEALKISELMKVRLSGDDFTIAPLNEEEQIIAETGYTEWAWDVTPLKSGKKVIHLHITLRIRLPFGEEKKDHPVLDREVIVKVSPFHSSKLFIVTYWRWVITALILPFIGWTLNTCIKK